MKRKFVSLLATIMILGSSSTAFAASFSDINNVPWEGAKTYINRAADLGLMVGDDDIKTGAKVFRAKDKVTYCETTQLAYNLLKKSNNLKSTTGLVKKWESVLKGYNIPKWAYESVSYALENNILSLTDVSKFMKNSTTNNNATREGVAVIIGKSLASMNTINNNATLNFKDKSSIAPTSVPYVDLLVRLNILVGDDENNFNAKNYINRAEMAVIVCNTNDNLANTNFTPPTVTPPPVTTPEVSATTAKGTVTKVESNMITVATGGKNMGFFGTSDTFVVKENTTEQLPFSSIKVGDMVTVDYKGATINKITMNYIAPGSTVDTNGITGKIDEITNERIYVNKSTGGMSDYRLASNVEIIIDGKSKYVKDLVDADKNGVVDVTVYLNSSGYAKKIDAKTGTGDSITGEIKTLDSYEIYIKNASGKYKTYELSSNVSVKLEDRDSSLTDVKNAMKNRTMYVSLYVNSSDRVTKMFVSKNEFDDETTYGTITSFDSSDIRIKRSSGSSKTYELEDNVTIKLDGSSSTVNSINKKMNNYDVYATLTLNSKGYVTRVEATTTDKDEDELKGRITSLDRDELKLRRTDGTSTYTMSSDPTITLDGRSSTISKINSAMDDGDVYATISLSSSTKVTKITATTDEDSSSSSSSSSRTKRGKLVGFYTGYVAIKDNNDKRAEYYFSDDVTYTLNSSSSSKNRIDDAFSNYNTVNVVLTLDSRGEITKLAATTDSDSSSDDDYETVRGVMAYTTNIGIKVDITSSKSQFYDWSGSVTYKLNNSTCNLIDIEDAYAAGYTIEVTLSLNSRGEVTKVDAKKI